MIALLTSYWLIFYILVPGILFRFLVSLRVRLKLFTRTRTQEATFSIAVAVLPFALALAGVWHAPVMRHWPFRVDEGTIEARRLDYERTAEFLLSPDSARSRQAAAAVVGASAPDPWEAIARVTRRQARFLFWYYVLTVLEGALFGYLASKYGDWQPFADGESGAGDAALPNLPRSHRDSAGRRLYGWFAAKMILPHISEWHILLTAFNWAKKERLIVIADVLQSDDRLYKGRVVDYFVDGEGRLTGILLHDVMRFDREAFKAAKEVSETTEAGRFWKTIPSRNFYIGVTSISNLNMRYTLREDRKVKEVADDVFESENLRVDKIRVLSEEDGEEGV